MSLKYFISAFCIIILSLHINCTNKDNRVELSHEMAEFLEMIKGTSDDVTKALMKFGANDVIKENDMGLYDLKDPVVINEKDNCYSVEFTSFITIRMYDICWKDGKITAIFDKGIK